MEVRDDGGDFDGSETDMKTPVDLVPFAKGTEE